MAFYIGMSTYIFPGKCPIYLQKSPLFYWISLSLSSPSSLLRHGSICLRHGKDCQCKTKHIQLLQSTFVQKANVLKLANSQQITPSYKRACKTVTDCMCHKIFYNSFYTSCFSLLPFLWYAFQINCFVHIEVRLVCHK